MWVIAPVGLLLIEYTKTPRRQATDWQSLEGIADREKRIDFRLSMHPLHVSGSD